MLDEVCLRERGYTIVEALNRANLAGLQAVLAEFFTASPLQWHLRATPQDEHVLRVKQSLDLIIDRRLVRELVLDKAAELATVVGADIDIQCVPHLRVTRPDHESDFVDWHRDTFYGNGPAELNLWIPIHPLRPGSGLRLFPGSHRIPSHNVRNVLERDPFRKQVTRGSLANQIGYTYSPRMDDFMASMSPQDSVLVAPEFGNAVLFFGSMVHRGENHSDQTRFSLDVRVRHPLMPTSTRPGYYEPLVRGVVWQCVQDFEGGAA
jgi:hypothetical protein